MIESIARVALSAITATGLPPDWEALLYAALAAPVGVAMVILALCNDVENQ